MIYNWFNIINETEFLALDVPSKSVTVVLTGFGLKTIEVVKGVGTALVYDDVFLPVEMNEKNPFAVGTYATYIDDNDDIWLGIEDDE